MNMEYLQVTPDEQRVILLFEESDQDKKLKEVDQYLIDNQLEPKRKYSENRTALTTLFITLAIVIWQITWKYCQRWLMEKVKS